MEKREASTVSEVVNAKARWYAERGLRDGKGAQMWRFRLADALKEIPDAD